MPACVCELLCVCAACVRERERETEQSTVSLYALKLDILGDVECVDGVSYAHHALARCRWLKAAKTQRECK